MQSRLRVSVVLGTYNGGAFIEEQIESILTQSVTPNEIIVSDDGSTDSTLAIIERVVNRSTARLGGLVVTVLTHSGPSGVAQNFERGLKAAGGDIVFLADQDDVWSPIKVERMLEIFEREPPLLLLHSNATLVDGERRKLKHSLFEALRFSDGERQGERSGHAFEVLMKRNLVTGATAAMRRELITRAVPFPPYWLHDEWLAIIASLEGGQAVDFIDEELIEYRQHQENQVGASRLTVSRGVIKLVAERSKRNERLLCRAKTLKDRLSKMALTESRYDPYRLQSIEKLRHEQFRSALSNKRSARVGPIFGELRRGRYGLFGGGVRDAVRDLIQNAL